MTVQRRPRWAPLLALPWDGAATTTHLGSTRVVLCALLALCAACAERDPDGNGSTALPPRDSGLSSEATDHAVVPSPGPLGASPIQVFFSQPGKKDGLPVLDTTLDDKLTELFSLALPSARIRATLYKFDNEEMAAPFERAQRRGVEVELVFDDVANDGRYKKVKKRLAASLGEKNVHVCSADACIGDNNNHNKFYLLSKIADPADQAKTIENVVVQTSANLRVGHHYNFNDMVVFYNDEKLYSAYNRYWQHLRAENRVLDFLGGMDGVADGDAANKTRVYFMPSASSDPVLAHLRAASCPDGGAVRVAQSLFKQDRAGVLLKELIALKEQRGCDVSLVLRQDDTDYLDELNASGLTVSYFHRILDAGISLHSKFVLFDAQMALDGATSRRKLILTGSSNFKNSGLTNDEVIVRIENDTIYGAYIDHWQVMKQLADSVP